MGLMIFETRFEAEREVNERQKEATEAKSPITYSIGELFFIKRNLGFPGLPDERLMEDGAFMSEGKSEFDPLIHIIESPEEEK